MACVKGEQSRFNFMGEDEFKDFIDTLDDQKTIETDRFGVGVFETYLESEEIGPSLETALADDTTVGLGLLDEIIARFFPAARTRRGEYYSKNSLTIIRFSLARYFMKLKNVDITDSLQFPLSCKSFKASVNQLKQEGKGETKHHIPISDEDMTKIQASLDVNTSVGLQRKVFIDVMMYFGNRGREDLRLMKPSNFIFHESDDGRQYVELCDTKTKNNKGNNSRSQVSQMFEKPGHARCPVKTLKKYLSKLNPERGDVLFQRPKTKYLQQSPTWYDGVLGKSTLGTLMKVISEEVGCETIYTNHCLRVTPIAKLGYSNIMTISNSDENAIKQCARSSNERRSMLDVPSDVMRHTHTSSNSCTEKRNIAEEDEHRVTTTIRTLDQDEEGFFGATVSAKLRTFPPRKKAKAQMKIMEALFEIELED
ncbi:uncharacterized protein LOC117116960 [Anneissia japonica]|uniref:uncharacterized protein LOC117116960 n=1 Tax=Anneissia japonica TaxID=1529436 RepID=UPI0014254B96|nr:uncharacterized protein LOC117116960 [Anneissia japonica]